MSDYNIQKGSTIFQACRMRGGMTEQEVKEMLEYLNGQIIGLQTALAATKDTKPKYTSSIVDAIRKGHMKEISPKKYNNMQTTGSFKVWAKDMKDYIFWHDQATKELIEHFEAHCQPDTKLTFVDITSCCTDKNVDVETDKALHMVLGAVLEGEAKMLAETAEVSDPSNMEMRKSGLELWRLLKYNFDRASAFNVISILEGIRNMPQAKNMQDVLPKITALERAHQEYYRQAVASKDPEFVKMRAHGIGVYPEVFKKADLLKVIPEVIVKEFRKSTNINFESDSYSDIRDVVNTIVHNHLSTNTPMDVDKKHIMSIEKEGQEAKEKEEEEPVEEQYPVYDDEGGFVCFIGKGGSNNWQTKGKGKSKGGKFEGTCYNCGKLGHRSRDCWSKGKGKGEQKGKGNEQGKGGFYGGKGQGYGGYGGKGKGLNAFESHAFAPQPQPVNQPSWIPATAANRLMTTSWNGHAGNFGGLNLFCLGKEQQEKEQPQQKNECSTNNGTKIDRRHSDPKNDRRHSDPKIDRRHSDPKIDRRHSDPKIHNRFQALAAEDEGGREECNTEPIAYTMGDAICEAFKKARQTKRKKARRPQFVNPGAGQAILDKIKGDQSGGSAGLKTLDNKEVVEALKASRARIAAKQEDKNDLNKEMPLHPCGAPPRRAGPQLVYECP